MTTLLVKRCRFSRISSRVPGVHCGVSLICENGRHGGHAHNGVVDMVCGKKNGNFYRSSGTFYNRAVGVVHLL